MLTKDLTWIWTSKKADLIEFKLILRDDWKDSCLEKTENTMLTFVSK